MKRFCYILPLILSFSAFSDIYKCEKDGKTSFQSQPCPSGNQEVIDKEEKFYDMDGSWFRNPKMKAGTPSCNDYMCTCSSYSTERNSDKLDRLTESMASLPYSWDNYDHNYKYYIQKMKTRGKAETEKASLEKAGCRVAMNQLTIKTLYPELADKIFGIKKDVAAGKYQKKDKCPKPGDLSTPMYYDETAISNPEYMYEHRVTWQDHHDCKRDERQENDKKNRIKSTNNWQYKALKESTLPLIQPKKK